MKKIVVNIVLITLFFASCKKKEDTTNVTNTSFKTYSSMDDVFSALATQAKTTTFDATADHSFYGNSGTRFLFKSNSFIDANGNIVTGNVQVQTTEWLKKGEMIFSGVLPVSYEEPIISGGEFSVSASKNGQPVFLRPGYPLQANIPQFGLKDTAMTLFRGIPMPTNGHGKINWQPFDSIYASGKIAYGGDTISIFSDSLSYCNADQFLIPTPAYQTFDLWMTVTDGTISDPSLFQAYAVYDGYNGVWGLSHSSGNSFHSNHIPSMPVHFVCFGLIKGHFYGGISSATPKTGEAYSVILTEIEPVDFKSQVNRLN